MKKFKLAAVWAIVMVLSILIVGCAEIVTPTPMPNMRQVNHNFGTPLNYQEGQYYTIGKLERNEKGEITNVIQKGQSVKTSNFTIEVINHGDLHYGTPNIPALVENRAFYYFEIAIRNDGTETFNLSPVTQLYLYYIEEVEDEESGTTVERKVDCPIAHTFRGTAQYAIFQGDLHPGTIYEGRIFFEIDYQATPLYLEFTAGVPESSASEVVTFVIHKEGPSPTKPTVSVTPTQKPYPSPLFP